MCSKQAQYVALNNDFYKIAIKYDFYDKCMIIYQCILLLVSQYHFQYIFTNTKLVNSLITSFN